MADQITAFVVENGIGCVNLIEDSRRYYPYGSLASTVLGFCGSENKGAYGLESYYEKTLAGTPGMVVSVKNAKSGDMPYSYEQRYEAEDANSLVLTIDEVVQHSLETHLAAAVREHNVQNKAVGIAMNVKTGEILAMTTQPDFDPNEPTVIKDEAVLAAIEEIEDEEERAEAMQKAQFAQWRNKAVSDAYEPGSVFKIITGATALEVGATTESGTFYTCTGSYTVAGRVKSCWKAAGHGTIDFTHAVMYSCNPAFMMIGQAIGAARFQDFFERFGLREATGLYFKVVDADDWVDAEAYPKILDALRSHREPAEQLDALISNYIYDKVGATHKHVMQYRHALPQNRVFGWDEAHFHTGEYMLMHSVIYRRQLLIDCKLDLPKHTFYVDELYVYLPLPYVKHMMYLDVDFYHYFIGRDDQSVHEEVMIRRIDQALRVNKLMITGVDLTQVKPSALKDYMTKYLEIVTTVSSVLLTKAGTDEHLAKKQELWDFLKEKAPETYRVLRRRLLGRLLHLKGKTGRRIMLTCYGITQRIYGFN